MDEDETDGYFSMELLQKSCQEPIIFNKPNEGKDYYADSSISICKLYKPFPNPFNPVTTIEFSLSEEVPVTLSIFNVHGNLAKKYYNNVKMCKGEHFVIWDGKNDKDRKVTSGVYFVYLKAGDYFDTERLVLIR